MEAFPCFGPIYQEIMEFAKDPEELIGMLSKELYIMDKNMERLMVTMLQKEAEEAKEELKKARAEAEAEVEKARAETRAEAEAEIFSLAKERDIFKLSLQGKKPDEIAGELQLSVEYVNSVLNME